MSPLAIGIDVGGTFTDIVLMNGDEVAWSSKFPSSSPDFDDRLAKELSRAALVANWLGSDSTPRQEKISQVSLCSTLATNALVNRTFRPALLILIGYPDACLREVRAEASHMEDLRIVSIAGGHDRSGDEKAPLDDKSLRALAGRYLREVEGAGISSFYGTRNHAHEIKARKIVAGLSGIPCVCGSELSNALNSVRRAVTCALNASLIPISRDMIDRVCKSIEHAGISSPLFVIRGDGHLMTSESARLHPIQMLLSGPAASALGAMELMKKHSPGRGSFTVIDMGGTTTDIVGITDSSYAVAPDGGSIGGYRTMVPTSDVRTVGIGGDSFIDFSSAPISIGPDRVLPISLLPLHAKNWRELIEESDEDFPHFIVPGDRFESAGLFRDVFLDHIGNVGADRWDNVSGIGSNRDYAEKTLRAHERAGRILRCAFTPTDALVILGMGPEYDAEPAYMAARSILRRSSDKFNTPEQMAEYVGSCVAEKLAGAILRVLMEKEGFTRAFLDGEDGKLLSRLMLCNGSGTFQLLPKVSHPVACIGTPMPAYTRELGKITSTTCATFEHGAVGGAIGAALARKYVSYTVWIQYLREVKLYRAHLPDGVEDFGSLEAAVAASREKMSGYISRFSEIGVKIEFQRNDRILNLSFRKKC